MIHRGDVVLVANPYVGSGSKNRPAIIVQCDQLNYKLDSTVVAAVTTNLKRLGSEPLQMLIDPATKEGQSAGLTHPSAVKCENLFTISQKTITKHLGRLSDPLLQQLENCLKTALELS